MIFWRETLFEPRPSAWPYALIRKSDDVDNDCAIIELMPHSL
jgi:hypothetical protein